MLENLVYPKLLWYNMTIEIWVIIYQVKMLLVQTISRKDLENSKIKNQSVKWRCKIKNFRFWFVVLIFVLCILNFSLNLQRLYAELPILFASLRVITKLRTRRSFKRRWVRLRPNGLWRMLKIVTSLCSDNFGRRYSPNCIAICRDKQKCLFYF